MRVRAGTPSREIRKRVLRAAVRRDTLFVVRSVRLDLALEQRVARAAAARGESISEFLRRAAAERADAVLAADPEEQFADVLGVVSGGGGRARESGRAFSDALAESRSRKR